MAVYWRGVSLDERSAAMMEEVAQLCPGINIDPSQGSWSGAEASAGTHSGCGAIDITNLGASQCDTVVREMRRVGWAAWHRTPEQSDWVRHVHGIAVQPGGKGDRGCLSSGAHDQVYDYFNGRNGLASNAPDDATREFVGVTWESYQSGGDDMTPEQAESLAECRRMLGVLLGHQPPATAGEARLLEDTSETRRQAAVLLGARPPAHSAGEKSIPEQLS